MNSKKKSNGSISKISTDTGQGVNALIRRGVLDDFDRRCSTLKRLPNVAGDGGMMVGIISYELVAKERKAEGLTCPLWENLDVIYENGRWK